MMHVAQLVITGWLASHTAFYAEGPPQLDDNTKPFFEAEPTSGALSGALLLCRIDVVGDKGWDTFGAVDIRATFTAGGRMPSSVWGPEDRASAVVGVPAFDVKPGEKIKIVVEDRDVTENELIARGSVTFEGKTPFRYDLQDTQVECRALAHDMVLARARPLLTAAAAATSSLESTEPKIDERGLGFSALDDARAFESVREAEAWVGGADADVKAAKTRMDRAHDAFQKKARDAVAQAKASLPDPGSSSFSIPHLGVIARITKGPAISLEITPADKKQDVDVSDNDVAAAVSFLSSKGEVERSAGTALENGPQAQRAFERTKLKAGETRIVRLTTYGALPDLLRVNDAGTLVRLR